MRRLFIGLCSIASIIAGLILVNSDSSSASETFTAGGCVRAGMLLGAVWLSWPQTSELIERLPRWVGMTLLGCLVVIVFRPKLILFVAPILLALLVLHWLGLLLRPKRRRPSSAQAGRGKSK